MRAPRGCCEQGAPWRPAPGLRGGRGSMPRHARIRRPARRGRRAGPTNHEVARSARGAGDEGSPEGSSGTSVRSLRSKARPPIGARRASTQASGGGCDMDGATRECASAASLLSEHRPWPPPRRSPHARWGARGDSPQCGPKPHQGHHTTTSHLRSVQTGPGPASACPTRRAKAGGLRPRAHCERAGAQERGHRARQDTLHDQDTCRVCSPDDSQERVVGAGCACAP
jgi:hypothetical protein